MHGQLPDGWLPFGDLFGCRADILYNPMPLPWLEARDACQNAGLEGFTCDLLVFADPDELACVKDAVKSTKEDIFDGAWVGAFQDDDSPP